MRFITCLTLFLLAALTLPTVASADFAINEYTQAIESSPDDVKYKFYLLRGKAYKDTGQPELALHIKMGTVPTSASGYLDILRKIERPPSADIISVNRKGRALVSSAFCSVKFNL